MFTGPAWEKRKLWERSLTKETYTVPEAADVLNMGDKKVRGLIKSGEIKATQISERNTLIPREAILDYVAPNPLKKMFPGIF